MTTFLLFVGIIAEADLTVDTDTREISDFISGGLDGEPYICNQCGVSFKDKSNCRRHVRNTHFSEPPHPCSLCSSVLKNRVGLQYHMKKYHPLIP